MSQNYLPAGKDVLSVISNIGQQNFALELTKSFRGVVFRQDVGILDLGPDDGEATFRVTDNEICAALDGEVFLHSRSFPKPVAAHLKSLNLSKGRFVLSDFAYMDAEWKKRRHERVQPKRPIYVTMHWKEKTARVCIENISLSGMGIFAFKFSEKGLRIKPGSNIQLDFQLPPDHKFPALKGKVIYIKTIGAGSASIIGVRLFPQVNEARALEGYIAQRKQEILEELNQAFWELIQPRGVESLYF